MMEPLSGLNNPNERFGVSGDKKRTETHGEYVVVKILNDLDNQELLRKGEYEFLDTLIPKYVEMLNEECQKESRELKENFRKWILFWSNQVHSNHSYGQVKIEECPNLVCESAINSINELR